MFCSFSLTYAVPITSALITQKSRVWPFHETDNSENVRWYFLKFLQSRNLDVNALESSTHCILLLLILLLIFVPSVYSYITSIQFPLYYIRLQTLDNILQNIIYKIILNGIHSKLKISLMMSTGKNLNKVRKMNLEQRCSQLFSDYEYCVCGMTF